MVWAVQPAGEATNGAFGNIAKVGTIYHDGIVFVGTNDGNRNASLAVKSSDGSLMWSFYSAAEPGRVVTDVNGVTIDAGATWGPNGATCVLTAGTSPWLHGAVDPELGLFYVTYGNVRSCGSSQDGQTRPGDNLFGNSIVALDMRPVPTSGTTSRSATTPSTWTTSTRRCWLTCRSAGRHARRSTTAARRT